MRICVACMQRTGSTVVLNTLRLALEIIGSVHVTGITQYTKAPVTDHIVVWCHLPRIPVRDWFDTIFTTKRDIRDVMASYYRILPTFYRASRKLYKLKGDHTELLLEKAKEFTRTYRKWRPFSDYEFVYERYVTDPLTVTCEIIAVLGLPKIDAAEIVKKVRNLPMGTKGKPHPVTRLWDGHKTDGRIHSYANLPNKVICKLEKKYPRLLHEHTMA